MKVIIKNIKYIIIFLLLLNFLLTTCREGNEELSLDNPINTLRTFVGIHNHHNNPDAVSDLNKTLADDLIFHFYPSDVGKKAKDGYIVPESWDKYEFFTLAGNMLKNAYSINLSVSGYENGSYNQSNTSYLCITDFDLSVYVSSSDNYEAKGQVEWILDLCDDGKWRISTICDYTTPHTQSYNIKYLSWHDILLLFK